MSDSRPIGLFDSGVGGLTVSRQVFRLMPRESTIYYADNAHVPYGPRSAGELIAFADQIVAFLIDQGVKYIIFACNTNSSISLDAMRERYRVPMIGLVEPGAREALRVSKNRRIGLVATEATVKNGAYQRMVQELAPDAVVFSRFAPRLVPLVEAGRTGTEEARAAVEEYVGPLKAENIDTLILGCTHYPFLSAEFRQVLGPGVNLVDPAAATVLAAREEMRRLDLLCEAGQEPRHRYFASGNPRILQEAGRRFLGWDIPPVRQIKLGRGY